MRAASAVPGSSTVGGVVAHRRLQVGRDAVVGARRRCRVLEDADAARRRARSGRRRGARRARRPAVGDRERDELAEAGLGVGAGAGAAAVGPARRGAGAGRAGCPPGARRGGSCGRPSRRSACPWSRGSAACAIVSASAASLVVTAPPSPKAPRFLDGKNEKVAIVPQRAGAAAVVQDRCRRPGRRPRCTGTPSASISAIGATLPNRWTAITALVRGVSTAAHRLRRSCTNVSGSTSHQTGTAPSEAIGSAEAKNVKRRDDDLVARADAQRAQREQQRVGAVGHADGVRRCRCRRRTRARRPDLGAEDEAPASRISLTFARISASIGGERRGRVEERDGHAQSG